MGTHETVMPTHTVTESETLTLRTFINSEHLFPSPLIALSVRASTFPPHHVRFLRAL